MVRTVCGLAFLAANNIGHSSQLYRQMSSHVLGCTSVISMAASSFLHRVFQSNAVAVRRRFALFL
jgi:hypothetical protein